MEKKYKKYMNKMHLMQSNIYSSVYTVISHVFITVYTVCIHMIYIVKSRMILQVTEIYKYMKGKENVHLERAGEGIVGL